MEGEAHPTCLGFLAKFLGLCDLLKADFLHLESPINSMKLDLQFLMMLLWGLGCWEQSKSNWHLRSIINTLTSKLSWTAKELSMDVSIVLEKGQSMNWEELSYDFVKTIQQFKPQAKEICILSLAGAFKCQSCQHNQESFLKYTESAASFIDFILHNIKALLHSNIDLIAPVNKQIAIIQRKLEEFPRFISPINRPITNVKILRKVISRTQTWANHISCLACLCWTNGMDESLASTMEGMFNDLMTHKFMPYSTSGVVASYLEDTMISQLLGSYFDSLFENFLVIPMNDDIEILRDGLIYLLSFVVDPPSPEEDLEDSRELILAQIYAIINELPYLLCSTRLDEIPGFLQKINRVKAEVGELYGLASHSSKLNSPKTNPIGLLDSLLSTLKKMAEAKVSFIPSIRHQVVILQNELALLIQFLQSNNIGLQNERGELKDLWTKMVNIVYYATYVTNLCSAKRFCVWYGITGLVNVIEDLKRIKTEIQKIEVDKMSNKTKITPEMESRDGTPPRATTSKIEGAIIGFEEIAEVIIDNLTRGQKSLTIISISGLPGQGKTTLAKKIYNDCKVEHHFHKTAWCYVSKDFATQKLLMKIIHDLEKADDSNDNVKQLETQDLADLLWKSLKGRRYFIVMDDIWDVNAWHKIKGSFPDDNNGSRILFTSRSHNLASQANSHSISYHLEPFSDDKNWELMEEKLFPVDGCPPEFLEVGKQIASYCKGLPLAVVLIACVLGRIEQKLDLWNKVAENLKAHLASEGCMNIIELSYNHLPDYLKPCFLYFGAFPRGEYILAKKLKLLWIAEGFIKDSEMESSSDLANKYLNHLVSQNLVVVMKISSTSGIKLCGVHDLLYDLCLGKAKEENFLDWTEKSIVVDGCYSCPQKYIHHRLCIREIDPFVESRPICSRKELPTSQVQSLLWFLFNFFEGKSTLEDAPYFLESFKGVLVLNLEAVAFSAFPEVVLSMIQLRFLALWGGFESIPSSIANLCDLETLIIPFGEICLPNSLWTITSLRYVKTLLGDFNLEDCEENNPSFAANNIERLGNLRLVRDSKKREEIVRKLRKLGRLRKLHCHFKTKDYHPSFFSLFSCLENLESLFFAHYPYGETSSLLFEELELPRFKFPENLKKLFLWELQLPWSAISTIGKQLPNLEVLKLCEKACVGTCWDLKDGDFPKLKYLMLFKLDIEQINVSDCDGIPFPCLEQLVVNRCRKLKEFPSCFGEICTLNFIGVSSCSGKSRRSMKTLLGKQIEVENKSLRLNLDFSYSDCDSDKDYDDDDDDEMEEETDRKQALDNNNDQALR